MLVTRLLPPPGRLKYCLTQSNRRGWVLPGPVGRWKSRMRALGNRGQRAVVTASRERRRDAESCSLDAQTREQAEDLRGSDPGPRAQQPLVEVGGALGVQSLFPGAFNHPLKLRDAWHRHLWWRRTSR